jgi:transmembrane sensor
MSDYKDFRAQDFALNESFQKWVLNPDQPTDRYWNKVIESEPQLKAEIDEGIELVRLAGLSSDQKANAAYLDVWERVRSNAMTPQVLKSASRERTQYAAWAAACVGILAIGSYFLYTAFGAGPIYKTDFAETRKVVLEDGTTVTLNANSTLEISNWSRANDREVKLEGEAFFSVVKSMDRKTFTVRTKSGLTVQVLGTEFNVNTRRENLSVYLLTGQVKLDNGKDHIMLLPGQRADYDKSDRTVVVSEEMPEQAVDRLAWRDNLYVMNDLPLATVVRDIEENFGVRVLLNDSALNTKRVTAKVPAKDIDVLMKVLSEALEIEIERKEDLIIMSSSER